MSLGRCSVGLVLSLCLVNVWAEDSSGEGEKKQYAGPTTTGFLLPNGWHLTPAGEHVVLPDMTLNIHPLSDGKHVLVTSNGFNMHQLSLIDIESKKIVDKVSAYQSWFGLAVSADEKKVWWAGGGAATVLNVALEGTDLKMEPTPKSLQFRKEGVRVDKLFRCGLALDEGRGLLYSLDIEQGTVSAVDLTGKNPTREAVVGSRPYDICVGPDGRFLYISDWAKRQVIVVDPTDFQVHSRIAVGEHPTQIVRHPKDDRLFVVCASSNTVSVIDASRGVVIENIVTTLFSEGARGEYARGDGDLARWGVAVCRQRGQQLRGGGGGRGTRPKRSSRLHSDGLVSFVVGGDAGWKESARGRW